MLKVEMNNVSIYRPTRYFAQTLRHDVEF